MLPCPAVAKDCHFPYNMAYNRRMEGEERPRPEKAPAIFADGAVIARRTPAQP